MQLLDSCDISELSSVPSPRYSNGLEARQPALWTRFAQTMLPILCSMLIACSGTSSVVGPGGQEQEQAAQSVTSIEIHPSDVQVALGDTVHLSLEGHDQDGELVSLAGEQVRWTSSDTTIATVDPTGLVQPLSDGSARIEVSLVDSSGSGGAPQDSAHVLILDSGAGTGEQPDGGSGGSSDDGSGGDSDGGSGGDTDDGSGGGSDGDGSGEPGGAPSPDAADDFRAFPEAEGWGANALTSCDRSRVQVLRVTNLNASGAGSLRDALARVSDDVLSVVTFDVSGYIDLSQRIELDRSCVYVAGQTAPGDGITLRPTGAGIMLTRGASDVVLRYLRFRGGYQGDSRGQNNLLVASGHNVVLDHVTSGWTTNYLLGILQYDGSWSRPIYNISVQRSLFHEALAAHPTAIQISDQDRANPGLDKISLHHNLMANNHHRSPNGITNGLQVINNVVYNWAMGAGQGEHKAVTDWIGNYYKAGPMTSYPYEITHFITSHDADPSYYVSGNVGPHNDDPHAGPDAQWEGPNRVVACYYKCDDYGDGTAGQPLPASARRSSPLSRAPVPVDVQLATEAYNSVLADVGANARLTCDGRWSSNADRVDRRVVDNVLNGTGPGRPPETEDDVGGFPTISAGTPCADSDSDGMPDAFEDRFGLDPSDGVDASLDADGDGYANVEEFLNGTLPL